MPLAPSPKPSTQPRPVTWAWDDFSGGYSPDNNTLPLSKYSNTLLDSQNFKYIRSGDKIKLITREGLVLMSSGFVAGGEIYDIFYYIDASGNAYECVSADSDLKYRSSSSFVKIGDLASTRARMCRLDDKLIIADGGTLKYWDGTTYGEFSDNYCSAIDYLDLALESGLNLKSTGATRAAYHGTISANYTIKSIKAVIYKTGSPTGNAVAKIYASDGTTVAGTSGNLDVSTIIAGVPGGTYTFTFATSVSLTSGSAYYFSIEYSGGDDSNYITLGLKMDTFTGLEYYQSAAWNAQSDLIPIMAVYNTAPVATFAISKKNRVYCNNTSYPNRLYYSNTNDPNDWSTVNGSGFIIFDGHYQLNGVYPFYDDIYVFVDYPKAVYRITGDSPDEYVVKLMWRDITAENQDVIQDVGSDLFFKDAQGVISLRTMEKYGDIEKANISKDSVQRTWLYDTATWFTGKNISDNHYYIGGNTSYAVVFDQEFGIWTYYKFELGTGVSVTAYGMMGGRTYLGTSDGKLYWLAYYATQDNTTDYTAVCSVPWTDLGTLLEKDARMIDCVMSSASQETYDLDIYINNSTTAIKRLPLVSQANDGAYESPY